MNEHSKALLILSRDDVLERVIKNTKIEHNFIKGNVYSALLKTIISQQLSLKAADSIYSRFRSHFRTEKPRPDRLIQSSTEELRSLGLSGQKSNYVKNVATFFKNNKNDNFEALSDQEIIDRLITIKGVGEWTIQMVLIFTLNRLDIFPVNDLVIRKQTKLLYNLKGEKKELINQMNVVAQNWTPYRSIASRYLWAAENSNG